MTIAELRARAAELEAQRRVAAQPADRDPQEVLDPGRVPRVRAARRRARRHPSRATASSPASCSASAVIFVYYAVMWLGQSLAKGQYVAAVAGDVAAQHRARRRRRASPCGGSIRRREPAAAVVPRRSWPPRPRARAARAGIVGVARARPAVAPADAARPLRRHCSTCACSRCAWSAWPGCSTSRPSSTCRTSCSRARPRPAMLLQYFVVVDAAVPLLHHRPGGAAGGRGHDRRAHEEQRAHRDARLRHQPLPHGRAAAGRGGGRRRRRSSRSRSGCSAPANRRASELDHRDPRPEPAHVRRAQPQLAHRRRRRASTTTSSTTRASAS